MQSVANSQWQDTGIRMIVVEEIRKLAKKHDLIRVILFGSRARGDYRRESDIDLAVSGKAVDLFRLALEEKTDTLLQYDVVNLDHHLSQEMREMIQKEGKLIYEKI